MGFQNWPIFLAMKKKNSNTFGNESLAALFRVLRLLSLRGLALWSNQPPALAALKDDLCHPSVIKSGFA